jgi:mRNA-degrading endonuclease toxin of MazEF toxin-antitoxin module
VLTEADGMKHPCAVNLHNVLTVRQERLGACIARLGPERMAQVCAGLGFALGCGPA